MSVRITKWGNSLGVRIPKVLAVKLGLVDGSRVEISEEDGRLILERTSPIRIDLDDLLDEITEENMHGEISTGPPVGREVW